MTHLHASEEFVVGKYSIGYVSADFKDSYYTQSFAPVSAVGSFKTLPRNMHDTEVESELTPGICTLGDILAFIENPPEVSKDGYTNLFYLEHFVVFVDWLFGEWCVSAWGRGDFVWIAGARVFSPATVPSIPPALPLESSDPRILERIATALERIANVLEKTETEISGKPTKLSKKK